MEKPIPDLHHLYEASVQNVDIDLDFAKTTFAAYRNRKPISLREDFCGTAKLACRWVEYNKKYQAWGVDFDQPTLDWGMQHNLSQLTDEQRSRIHLMCDDVLKAETPPVDMVLALNFSFCIFKKREVLKRYMQQAYAALNDEGIFVMDIYGGTESVTEKKDDVREIDGFTTPDGTEVPSFEYTWEQAAYNPINHYTTCHIHFNIPDVGEIPEAFTYDWRLWTLPELQEILKEVGFAKAEVYLHDFDEDGESDDLYRRRRSYENVQGWVAYVVGVK